MDKKARIFIMVFTSIIAYIFANLLLRSSEIIFESYRLSVISSFLPFGVVLLAAMAILVVILVSFYLAFRDTNFGLNILLILLPMSALPFILLGYPLLTLNNIFICRSSIIFLVFILSFSWFIKNTISYKPAKFKLPLIGNIIFILLLYVLNLFVVDKNYIGGAGESLVVYISCFVFFYFLLSYIDNKEILIKIIKVLVISCFIQIVLSSLSFFYYLVIKGRSNVRIEGLFRDYELFAEYLAIHVPLIFYLIRRGNKRYKLLLKLSLFPLLFVMFSTQTRGAILALSLGMGYYLSALRKEMPVFKVLRLIFLGVVFSAATFFVLYKTIPATSYILERFLSTDISTLDTRGYVWGKFMRYFSSHPILGYGMVYDLRSYLFWPHNVYFYYLLTMGVTGLSAFLLFLFSIVKRSLQNIKLNKNNNQDYELSVTLNTVLIIFMIDNLKTDYLRYTNYQ